MTVPAVLDNFHSHTTLSDGDFAPMELMRRFAAAGYRTLAVTDHVGAGGMERLITEAAEDAALARDGFAIEVVVGVELTHVPPAAISKLARRARAAGAALVLVHGETLVEPTAPGTNAAAAACSEVDIIAHPGPITAEVARVAAENGVFLEITARKGHSLTNGHVARVAAETGARLVFGLDAHGGDDIVSVAFRDALLTGAGLSPAAAHEVVFGSSAELRHRAGLTP